MVSQAVRDQTYLFCMAFLWGALVVISYDVLRILRRIISHNKIVMYIQDLLFWLVTGLLIYRQLYQFDNGAIRNYTIFGMVVGMIAYTFLISNHVVIFVSKLLNKIIKILCKPFKFVIKLLKSLFIRISTSLKKKHVYFTKRLQKRNKRGRIEDKDSEKNKIR